MTRDGASHPVIDTVVSDASLTLRIVHLDADARVCAEVENFLLSKGVPVVVHHVATISELARVLEHEVVDVVLADYGGSGFEGSDALHTVRSTAKRLPFVFISSENSEQLATEAILNGACDYVYKGGLTRLLPAMRRVQREKTERYGREASDRRVDELLSRQQTMEDIIAKSPVIAVSWLPQPHWPVAFISSNVAQFGYSADEFLSGRRMYTDIVHPEDLDRVRDEVAEALAIRLEEYRQEYRILTSTGEVRWVDDRTRVTYGEAGDVLAVDGILLDITEQRNAIDRLRLEEARMNALYELARRDDEDENVLITHVVNEAVRLTNSTIGYVYFLSREGRGIERCFWSDAVRQQCAVSTEQGDMGFVTPETWNTCIIQRRPVVVNSFDRHEELPTGHPRLRRYVIVPVIEDGLVIAIAAVGNKSSDYDDGDVRLTRMVMLEMCGSLRKLRQAAQLKTLANAVAQSPAAILITDVDGVITYANPAATGLTGYGNDELIGRSTSMFKSGETDAVVYEHLWNTIIAGETWHSILRNRTKSGLAQWESVTIAPVTNAHGVVTNFIAVKQDMTAQKEIEEALTEARLRAEQAARMKDFFVATISHEIRTPLNVIYGYANLMIEEYRNLLPEEGQLYFEAIEEAGARLMRTVELLLHMSAIESGTYRPQIAAEDVNALVEGLVRQHALHAGKKGLFMEFHPHADPAIASIDRFGFEQALSNILDNAVKFTESGGIRVRSTACDGALRVEIMDTGCGMSEEFIHEMFLPFHQEKTGYSRPYDGLGLGLSLVKKYIDACGGSITVQSSQGVGSTFTIALPQG
ncbi:MAG TPA: PAS domain S-box protein [Bacteroidota bacterium]|nr:PAS domain S-box protein [Bacteroidota bacterium]